MRPTAIAVMVATALAAPALATCDANRATPTDAARARAPASTVRPTASPAILPPRHGPIPVEHYVDLNSASGKELTTLPGIGTPEADRIIANRPYLVKSDLVNKNVLTIGPFLSIKRYVVAMPKSVTQAKP
jgi:DNA uptake protein ComE-like DNA-binding protein